MSIKVFLVEDHDIVRQGINSLLKGESDISVVGEANDGAAALTGLKAVTPDIIIMDWNMPVMNGLECTRHVKKEYPNIKVLVLSMYDYESYLIDMLDSGADGYILKNTSRDELIFAIKKVAGGGMHLAPELTMNMFARYKSSSGFMASGQNTDILLSDREMDVLKLIAKGHTNIQIANELFTSVRTIETRRKNLLEKTGTTNTATLIRFAVLNGLIK